MATPHGSSGDNLQQALQEFQAELPPELRKDLEQATTATDDYHSVMHLTTKLDLATSKRMGESFAPRLLPFLYKIKDYAGVLDTFAQSHMSAALLWGSVKLCLILTSNWAEYFEALTRVLSRVGTISSNFSEFGSLFPSSQRLQDALNNYYAVVIRMCCKAVHGYKRPNWKQIPRKALISFDRDYGPLQRELEHCATVVKDEIDLASEERHQKDSAENALTYQSLGGKLDTQHGWQLVKAHLKVKGNLSKSDARSAWRHVRRQWIPGTSSWFETAPAFTAWRNDSESSTLVYSDKIGSGKTIVSANLIAALIQIEGTRYSVGYCLCQMLDAAMRSARNVLGCITRQLLEQVIDTSTSSTLLDLLEKSASGDVDTILRLLHKYLPKDRQTYIILDGMDELEHVDSIRILQAVSELVHFTGRSKPIKIFITSRLDSTKALQVLDMTFFELRPSKQDLEESFNEFIITTLSSKVETGQLNINSTDMIYAIMHAVQEGSQRMALWAKLMIERLCLMNNERDMLEALEDMKVPMGLAEIYNKILSRLEANREQRTQLIRILIWTIGAMRIMTTTEMKEAIAVEHGTTQLDDTALPDMSRLIHATGGLVYLDPDDDTVHLVHASLRTHLFTRHGTPTLHEDKEGSTFCFHPTDINNELIKICATFLKFSEFKRSMVRQDSTPCGPDPGRRLTIELGNNGKTGTMVAKILQKLQDYRQSSKEDTDRQLREAWTRILNNRKVESYLCHPDLLSYASYHWVHHGALLDPTEDTAAYAEFMDLVDTHDQHVSKAWEEAYSSIDALEARALDTASSCPSDYFSTSRFSMSTLKLIKWSFANNNSALLATAKPSADAKMGQSKYLSCSDMANLLSTIMNLMATTNKKDSMSKAIMKLLTNIDPDSAHTQVATWYAASLFNEPQGQVAPPTGWRHWSTTSEYLEDIFQVPHFELPQVALSLTGSRNKLGDFHKHTDWKSFAKILVHPLMLAAVLDHRKALTWTHGALEIEDRTDPFDAAIKDFDLLLDALYFAVLSGRRECCDILHKTMKQVMGKAPPHRSKEARRVRVARVIMWAQLRGYRDVARRLLDLTLPVYGRGILDEAILCTDDADNSLLFYLIELQDFDMLARLLLTLDGSKLSKTPTTAIGNTLADFARASIIEADLGHDERAASALHAIEAMGERAFGMLSNDSSRARGNTMTELERALTTNRDNETTFEEEDGNYDDMTPAAREQRRSQQASELIGNWDSTESLDPPQREEMTVLQAPHDSEPSMTEENVDPLKNTVGDISANVLDEIDPLAERFTGLLRHDTEKHEHQTLHDGSTPNPAHSTQGLSIAADDENGLRGEDHIGHDVLTNKASGPKGPDSAIGTPEKPALPLAAHQQECLHASAGAEELETKLNGGSPQQSSDSPKMHRRRNTVDRGAWS